MPYSLVLERASGTHIYSVQQELSLLTSTCSVVCLLPQVHSNKLRLAALEAHFVSFSLVPCSAAERNGHIYEFSGYGSKADVAAPGVDIYGIMPDGDFTFASGTSSATAIVTGIAALVKSYRPTLDINNLVKILKEGTKPLNSLQGKVASNGIIDAYQCLKLADEY